MYNNLVDVTFYVLLICYLLILTINDINKYHIRWNNYILMFIKKKKAFLQAPFETFLAQLLIFLFVYLAK